MLDRRATRIVWTFLTGVTVGEGAVLFYSFRGNGDWLAALAHFVFARPGTSAAWALAALVTCLYVIYAAAGSAMIREHILRPSCWGPFAAMVIAAVPMAFIAGFFEEAFFRKTLMDVAAHRGASLPAQIALSALAFGAAHAIWGFFGGGIRGAAGAMIATGALGAALAVVYILGGRSIAPCIAAHIAINLLIEPWLMITAATHAWTRRVAKPA